MQNRLTLSLILLALTGCGSDPAPNPTRMLDLAERGDLPALDALLATSPTADVRDSCQWTPLMKAALNGHPAAVTRLLDAGATIDAQDNGGYTAMMLAASNNHAAVVDLLLARGAAVDHQEATGGWTALIWAAKQGHLATVRVLLERGADRTLADFAGRTARDWAVEAGYGAVMTLLDRTARQGEGEIGLGDPPA